MTYGHWLGQAHDQFGAASAATLEHLEGISETVLLHHDGGKGRPRAQRLLTDMIDTQQQMFDLFELQRYASTR